MDVNEVMDKLKEHFFLSAHPHDNNELFTIVGEILPKDYKYGKVRRELSTFQKRLQFYFSLFKAQKYRPGMTAHEAFIKDMTILEDKKFPPTLRELYAVCEFLEQKIILLKITNDCEKIIGFYITPILRETSKREKIILLLTFVDGEPYFQHLEGDERKLEMCHVKLVNENHDMCLDKRFKNSFQELNGTFILKKVEGLNIRTLEEAMATITMSETEKTNIFVVLSQLVYGSECLEEFVKDHIVTHMKNMEFSEIYQAFVCLDEFEEEKKAIERLPEEKAKNKGIFDLRKKAFHFHLEHWDTVNIMDFFAVASVFNVEIYIKKGEDYYLFLPICNSFSKIFSSPIYLEQASNLALIPLLESNNCSCGFRKPLISGRFPVYQEMIEDFIVRRLALESCCPVGRHGTHKHFSTIKDSQIVPNEQISSYQKPLDGHVEKVIEVLDTQGRKLDQINGGKGSLEQCLSREIFGDEDKISFFKSRICGEKQMDTEEMLSAVASSTGKPVFVFKYYPENYSWVLSAPNSTTTGECLCRYYITIFYNGLTGYFDRIVAKNGCNCKLPSPAVDVKTTIDLKRNENKILAIKRHRPLLTFLSTDISETSFIDEVRRVPTVFSRYSEIPLITSRYDMQDKEIDLMSDYSYSLCRCVSKEIFGTENEFELIMKEVVDEIKKNPHLYGKFMRWDKNETENEKLFKRQKSVEKEQALFYANRIEDGMEMEDLELLAIATCFQVPVFVICVEEDKGMISTFWKEFTQLERKHRPRIIKNIARNPCCNTDGDGFGKFFIMVYRTFSGQFHRIVSKDEICNCLIDRPKVPEIEYHKVCRTDENIYAKIRSIENRLTVTRLTLDNWLRCNMALELLCTEIIDALESRRKNVNIALIVGSSVGLVGAALAAGGLIAAPFTAGVSLGLTIAGGVVGGMGGFTSAGSKISELILNKGTISQMERYQMNLRERSLCLEKSIKAVEKEFKDLLAAKDYVDSTDNSSLAIATSAVGSLTVVPVIVLRIIARVITLGDMILLPLSALLDAGILVYSIYNLVKGSRTTETEQLRTIRTVLKVSRVQMQIWGYGNQKRWEKNTNEIHGIFES